jgi:hypothetical protein
MIHYHLAAYDDASSGWRGDNRIVCYARTNRDEPVTVRQHKFGDREALSRYFSLRSVIVLLLQARTVAL